MIKILITGDLVVNTKYSADNISKDVLDLFKISDYNIVNLEAPVTGSNKKILKIGPHFKADKDSTLSVLKALNIDLVTLANNHVLDYDEQGVLDTLAFCREHSIATIGAGKNREEASKIFYLGFSGGKIAFINIAENEWASATDTSAGANGMDLIDNIKQIQEAKSKSDFVFVIVHGGHEYYHLPSPRIQKLYRFYAEQGADIIIGHHTHSISGYEVYNGVPIYYSLGNFLMTYNHSFKGWGTGLILEIKIIDGELSTNIIPVFSKKSTFELTPHPCEKEILKHIEKLKATIEDKDALSEEWENLVNFRSRGYLYYWSMLPRFKSWRVRNILSKANKIFLNKKRLSLYLSLMRNETHNDISQEVIKRYINK